jgi:hypothetical protein
MKTPQDLDKLDRKKWQQGLCHIYAQALHNYLGKGQFVCLWRDGGFAHVYLELNGRAYDSEHRGVPEEEIQKPFVERRKSDWPIEFAKRPTLKEFNIYQYGHSGIRFGDGPLCDAYEGPETERWLAEADAEIKSEPLYQQLKASIPFQA